MVNQSFSPSQMAVLEMIKALNVHVEATMLMSMEILQTEAKMFCLKNTY